MRELKSVIAISRAPIYILDIATMLTNRSKIKKSDIEAMIKKAAVKVEIERSHTTRPRLTSLHGERKSYGKRGLTIMANLTIKLLEQLELLCPKDTDTYEVTPILRSIGKLWSMKDPKAKLLLRSCFFYYGAKKNNPFRIGRFLKAIRDYKSDEIYIKVKGEIYRITMHSEGGLVYCEDTIFKDRILRCTEPTLTAIKDWGYFFRLTNHFRERLAIDNAPPLRVTCLVSAKRLASLSEIYALMEILQKIPPSPPTSIINNYSETFKVPRYTALCILECARALGIVLDVNNKIKLNTTEGFPKDILRRAVQNGMLAIDYPLGDLNTYLDAMFNPEKLCTIPSEACYVITDGIISLPRFHKVLFNCYLRTAGTRLSYARIHDVRRLVCKELKIHDDQFDELLLTLYRKLGPDKIQLVRGREVDLTRLERGVKFLNTIFFYIRVLGGTS